MTFSYKAHKVKVGILHIICKLMFTSCLSSSDFSIYCPVFFSAAIIW